MLEIIFYVICLNQIFLLSVHYPNKLVSRMHYILEHYPPNKYEKLYPKMHPDFATEQISKHLSRFKIANYIIASIGVGVLLLALSSGFVLGDKGGAEIFVVIYLFLQFLPHGVFELSQHQYYKNIKQLAKQSERSASLTPRNLSSFINPVWLYIAIALYAIHLVLFFHYQGSDPKNEGFYITLFTGTFINLGFAVMIYHFVKSWKLDPYQDDKDKYQLIRTNIRVLVTASIMMSLFFIIINSVREFGLDRYEPILMTLYFQILIFFGMGSMMREIKVDQVNFEGYKA